MELYEDMITSFFNWMNERHAIYLRRQRNDPWPWTSDPILLEYKFTNVYRELDTGTKWLRENFIEPHAQDKELFFNIASYRRYNWIGTAQELGYIDNYDPERCTALMMARRARGEQVFTGAHMLCGSIRDDEGNLPASKVTQIFGISFKKLWDRRRELEPKQGDTLESAFKRLLSAVPGFGAFITYEVITDLRHTRYLSSATDIMTWANPGPGAERGIVRLMKMDVKGAKTDWPRRADQIEVMKALLGMSSNYLAEWMDPLEMRDIEHSLCEWDKYQRVLCGEGKPRSRYVYKG